MNAEIICVGTELLLGDVVNTNASDIARGLAHMGINVYHHEVVGDNPQRLQECLRDSLSRCDLVLLTGGLGPTYDDLTKETVAAHFGRGLAMDEESLHTIERYFARTGRKMTENNRKQAMMPEGCIILQNPNGTAPGCIIEGENGKTAVMMPGPPREMRPMFEGPVTDYLMRRTHDGMLVSRTINFFGVGESELEARLREMMDMKVYIQVDSDVCLLRRIKRDIRDRGRDVPSITAQYLATVKPMLDKYIRAYAQHADIILPGGGKNPLFLDMLCLYIDAHVPAANAQ